MSESSKPTRFEFRSRISEICCRESSLDVTVFGDAERYVAPNEFWFAVNGMRIPVPNVEPLPPVGTPVRVTIDWSPES